MLKETYEQMHKDCSECYEKLYQINANGHMGLFEKLNTKYLHFSDQVVEDLDRKFSFFHKPASLSHHGNWRGGLFQHSLKVAKGLLKFTIQRDLEWERNQSPLLIGLFHDLCKVEDYEFNWMESEPKFVRSKKQSCYPGHGVRSILLLSDLGIELTKEERLCIIHHMGAFETDMWKEYSQAVLECPKVLYTHEADMLSSVLGV